METDKKYKNEKWVNKTVCKFQIAQIDVNEEVITKFLESNIVKFIFFGERHSQLASVKDVNEIHKLKSKFPANRWVRIPFRYDEEAKRLIPIKEEERDQLIDGYAVVDKHEIWSRHSDLKNTKKNERDQYAKLYCVGEMKVYSDYLNDKAYILNVYYRKDNTLLETIPFSGEDKEIEDEMLERIDTSYSNEYWSF